MARISTVSGPVNTLVRASDSPSRSMLSTVARIWQNSSVAPSVSTIATLPVVGSVGPDVPDESPPPPPPQAANVTNAAAAMPRRATRRNEMLLETGIVPSLVMQPPTIVGPWVDEWRHGSLLVARYVKSPRLTRAAPRSAR